MTSTRTPPRRSWPSSSPANPSHRPAARQGRTTRTENNPMSTAESKDGTRIAFSSSGDGPPLIVVDGAACYRKFGPATRLAAILSQRFTVFTYDRRGRGGSSDTQPYAPEREIEDLQA